jgi:hypothetical protein
MWNPEISSFKMENFMEGMQNFESFGLNWSVWDNEEIHEFDEFFMVRVGSGKTGIVMKGTVLSDPYISKDWSGRGRKVYYVDLNITVMVNPELATLLTTDELAKQIPDFDWTDGHSGSVLTDEQSLKLMNLWDSHQDTIIDEFDNPNIARRIDDDINPLSKVSSLKVLLKNYDFEIHTNKDERKDNVELEYITFILKNSEGEELTIDLDEEFTLSFGGWHTHYMATEEYYECLKNDVMSFLNNKLATVTFTINGKWIGSSTTDLPITSKEQAVDKTYEVFRYDNHFLNKIKRNGVKLECNFWNPELDYSIILEPSDIKDSKDWANRFAGAWKDDRSAEEIISEIRESRTTNSSK